MSKAKTRITAFVEDGLAKEFAELTRGIGISGTALLNRELPAELKYLAELPANSERAAAACRFIERLSDTDDAPLKVRRLNITLDREDAERMDQLCREKRVPRDSFIGLYLHFLVNDPLKRIAEMLTNPRREYEEKRWKSSPGPTGPGQRGDESEVAPENPYGLLHIDEEQLNLLERFMKKNRTPESK